MQPRSLLRLFLTSSILASTLTTNACANRSPNATDSKERSIQAEKTEVIKKLIKEVDAYVHLEGAQAMQALLHEKQRAGAYDKIEDPQRFAEQLNQDLLSVTNGDKHLGVTYVPDGIQVSQPGPKPDLDRYGYPQIELREDGIGYIDIRGFLPPKQSRRAFADAMRTVADAKVLILDLRQNGGGVPDGVAMVSSYFLEGKHEHLYDIVFRSQGRTESAYTQRRTRGPHFDPSKRVYILTSPTTRSAGEQFCDILQSRGRATIVGEVTAGAGHLSNFIKLDKHWGLFLPIGKPVNPITGKGWEAVGIQPDVRVLADEALEKAIELALGAVE